MGPDQDLIALGVGEWIGTLVVGGVFTVGVAGCGGVAPGDGDSLTLVKETRAPFQFRNALRLLRPPPPPVVP